MSTKPQAEPYPGPWEWEYHPDCHEPIALVSLAGDVLLATGDGGASWANVSPTHRAILAAAPDLLAACKALRSCLLAWADNGLQLAEANRMADAAIARAEGGPP